jgi:hypothetical protein
MNSDHTDTSDVIIAVFGGVLIASGISYMNQYLKHRALKKEMDYWASTEGVLTRVNTISDRMSGDRGDTAHYECTYKYEVSGFEYTGTRLRNSVDPPEVGIEGLFELLGLRKLHDFVADYVEGKHVTVWYDAQHPGRCTLDRGGASKDLIKAVTSMAIGLALLSTVLLKCV